MPVLPTHPTRQRRPDRHATSRHTIHKSPFNRARLEHCLEGLEPKRRSLIRAAFFDGLTYEELAARIEAPLGSIKSWIRRGLLQLRECLDP